MNLGSIAGKVEESLYPREKRLLVLADGNFERDRLNRLKTELSKAMFWSH